jgi:imidazolonepropionase-like amidohydrolase
VRAIVEEARAAAHPTFSPAYSPDAIRRSIDFGVRSIKHGNLIDRPPPSTSPTPTVCRADPRHL